MRDHNNERGWVHPDLTGRYAIGYHDDDGYFHVLWTEDDAEHTKHCERVKQARAVMS